MKTPYKPARKIQKSSVKNIVRFPSIKNNRTMLLESILESEYALLLEFDTKVESYFEQPETFKLEDGTGKKFTYTPDFLIVSNDGQRKYIEIKPSTRIQIGNNLQKYNLFQKKVNSMGIGFEVISEDKIQKEPLLTNLKFFYKYRTKKLIDPQLFEKISGYLSKSQEFKELIHLSDLKPLYSLVAHGFLQFDIKNEVFSSTSVVWLNV